MRCLENQCGRHYRAQAPCQVESITKIFLLAVLVASHQPIDVFVPIVVGLIQEMISPRASKRENSFYEELARESPFRSGPDSRTPRYETTLQGIYQVDEQSQQMMPVGDPISNLLQMPKSPTSSNSRNAPLSPSRSYGRTQSSPAFSHNGRTCSHTNEKVHTYPTYLRVRTGTHAHTYPVYPKARLLLSFSAPVYVYMSLHLIHHN